MYLAVRKTIGAIDNAKSVSEAQVAQVASVRRCALRRVEQVDELSTKLQFPTFVERNILCQSPVQLFVVNYNKQTINRFIRIFKWKRVLESDCAIRLQKITREMPELFNHLSLGEPFPRGANNGVKILKFGFPSKLPADPVG